MSAAMHDVEQKMGFGRGEIKGESSFVIFMLKPLLLFLCTIFGRISTALPRDLNSLHSATYRLNAQLDLQLCSTTLSSGQGGATSLEVHSTFTILQSEEFLLVVVVRVYGHDNASFVIAYILR